MKTSPRTMSYTLKLPAEEAALEAEQRAAGLPDDQRLWKIQDVLNKAVAAE